MTRLLVPIQLAALVERVSGEIYADSAFKPADRNVSKPTRQRILPAPFADSGTRPAGVHLHWALPDALARYDAENKRFPRLPCRWVVIRSSGAAARGARQVRAWLLPDIHQPVVSVLPLPDKIPGTSGSADLDITGPDKADPSWFAYYDNTINRLSFHDELAGVSTGPLSYLVCGWYVRTRNDLLNADPKVLSEAALRQRLAGLGWEINEPLQNVPTGTLYHGAAVAIGWPAPGWPGDGAGTLLAERDSRPDSGTLHVGLGDRMSAVVAELLTSGNIAAAQLVEMLVGGEILDLGQVSGDQLAAANAHRHRFVAAMPPSNTGEIVFTPDALAEPSVPVPASRATLNAAKPGRISLLEADALARAGVAAPVRADPFSRATTSARTPFAATTGVDESIVDPGELERVVRPTPRTYLPLDPQIALLGAGRTYRHGEDGRFSLLDRLPCRLTGSTVSVLGRPGNTDGVARELLPHKQGTGDKLDLPTSGLGADLAADVEALLVEVHALDPAMNPASPGDVAVDALAQLRADWLAAQARRSMPGADPGAPPPEVRTDGVPPAPLSITLPERPWHPLHLDWRLDWTPSPRGAHDWVLDEIDFEPAMPPQPVATVRPITGKAILTSTPARTLSDALSATLTSLGRQPDGQAVIDQLVAAFGALDVNNLLFRFAHADLVGAQLDGYLDRLRGTPEGTWINKGGIVGSASVRKAAEDSEQYEAEPLVAGTFVPGRFRLVDTFGRILDVPVTAQSVAISHALQHPNDPAVALQRPRFTAPATIEFRYISPSATGDLSRTDVGPGETPLTGLLTPNPFDGSLEIHDADGVSLGQLRLGPNGRALWQESPGTAATAGAPPAQAIGDGSPAQKNLAAIVEGIVRADESSTVVGSRGGALATLLRAIDVARFTIDPTAKVGNQHLQALLGNPVAVMRARLRLSLADPQAGPARTLSVPVRLGSIGNLHDGLLCFYLTGQPDRLRLIHPALAEAGPLPMRGLESHVDAVGPITGAEADTSGIVWVDLNRDLDLLLLVTPGGDVSLTSGLVPSKVLEMQREWIDKPISQLTPTLRFDAVLRDPLTARIPVATDIHGQWSWHHRISPVDWKSETVQQPVAGQLDPARPAVAEDGYLRVTLIPEQPYEGIRYKIIAIRRYGLGKPIARVRVSSPTGKITDLNKDEAIQMALSGRFAFFTEVVGFPKVDVIVDTTDWGSKFLRTNADQTTGNNLASLPNF